MAILPLEAVLDRARQEVKILERNGAAMAPAQVEALVAAVEAATIEFREWMSEDRAVLRSKRPPGYFRARFPEWEQRGLARWDPTHKRKRQYRMMVVPMATDAGSSITAEAEAAARAVRTG